MNGLKQLVSILDAHERRRALLVLALMVIVGLVQMVGVASVMPFMAVVGNPEFIRENAVLAWMYETLGFASDRAFLALLGGMVFTVLLASLAINAFGVWVMTRFAQMCNYRLSTRLLGTYLRRPYAWFLNRHSADLGKTVLAEIDQLVTMAILPRLKIFARSVLTLALLGLVVAVDPITALVAVVLLGGAYGALFVLVRQRLSALGESRYLANQARYRMAQESLGGIKDVKISGLEESYLQRYYIPARQMARSQAKHVVISQLPKFLMEAIAFGGMLVLVIVLLLRRDGVLGEVLPILAVYAFAGFRLMPALQEIYQSFATIRYSQPVVRRLCRELAVSRPVGRREEVVAQDVERPLKRELQLRDASFTYPGGQTAALKGIDLVIPANSRVAFVGTTGAGKTTLVDILLALLEPESGALIVDGQRIDATNAKSWRRTIGYVPQQIYLIDDTITANIAFGVPPSQVDVTAVETAARAAELHDFITRELPHGYGTEVGERGVRLSGGQRQRLGIARALYRNPSVLVFDEATSALDNITERAVMRAVDGLEGKKTIIMIAHRLTTVERCDCIFMLEHGRIVAAGSYGELLAKNRRFQALASAG